MFNLKFIKWLIGLAALAVVTLPIYVFFFLLPSIEEYIISGTETEAVRVATHLSSLFFSPDTFSGNQLPDNIEKMASDAESDFNLRKLKVFSALGEVLYSTSPEDIGTINRNSYFHEIVAAGNEFTKVVQKEGASLEGQIFMADVVETYVPVLRNGKFIGAFEIYYDISVQLAALRALMSSFYRTALPIVVVLLIAMFFTLMRFRDNFIKRLSVQRELRDNEQRYRTLFEQSNDAILVCETEGLIQQVNERAANMLGFNQTRLVGMSIYALAGETDQGDWHEAMDRVMKGEDVSFESHLSNIDGNDLNIEVRAGITGRNKDKIQAIIRDVTEQKKDQREVKRSSQTQTVLNKLLHLSLENLSLTETLELFIYYITSFPWLELEPKGAIFLVGDSPGILELKAHRGLNESLLTICAKVPFGKCLCGRCAMTGEVVFANCIDDYHDNSYEGIAPHGHYCVPILSVNRRLIGVFTLYIQADAARDRMAEDTLEAAASVIAGVIQRKRAEEELQKTRDKLEVRVQERTIELEEANLQLGQELSERMEADNALAVANQEKDDLIVNLFEIMYEMLANRDHSTFEHALRVAEISRRIGLEMGLEEDDMEALRLGCLVHDIGKVAIPDDVLLKPGVFDRMDRNIMQVHPLVGASLFAKHHHDYRIRRIILHHHERLDGSGYPYGLKGDEIGPLERIVAGADVFEAMLSRRPYKKPITRKKAIDVLWYEVKEGRLDPDVVQIIEKITEDWSPLEIKSEFRADYSEDLEVFRQMSYFREPLSDFYNYRYLLYLDDAKMLTQKGQPYHLVVTSFPDIRNFNSTMGFIKADQVLDEIGQKLHQTAEEFDAREEKEKNKVMVLRKGSDFLIYSDCNDDTIEEILGQIVEHLEDTRKDWGLDSKYNHFKFDEGYPAEQALNKAFSIH